MRTTSRKISSTYFLPLSGKRTWRVIAILLLWFNHVITHGFRCMTLRKFKFVTRVWDVALVQLCSTLSIIMLQIFSWIFACHIFSAGIFLFPSPFPHLSFLFLISVPWCTFSFPLSIACRCLFFFLIFFCNVLYGCQEQGLR